MMPLTRPPLVGIAAALLLATAAGLPGSGASAQGRPARQAEGAAINRVTVEGNSRVKYEQISPELQAKSRGPFSQSLVDADVARLREIYRRSGRSEAVIEGRVTRTSDGRYDVAYIIKEGDKTGVASIDFVGNRAYGSSKLRGVMTTTESNLLSFLKTTDVYDPDRVAADLDLIRRLYLRNGYADFRIVKSDVRYDVQQRGYIIIVTVDEGEQYRIGSVTVESRLPGIDEAFVRRRVTTSAGEVYNADAVERSVEMIAKDAASSGNAFAQVRPRGDRNPASRTVNLGYVVEEGPRVYIERINVRGNTRTRDYVVRREFDLGEGDPYNRVLLDRGVRRLNNLGYFKKVTITNEPGSSPDRVVVNVDIEDQPTGQFSVAGGYSTADGPIGDVGVQESNFLGRGQYARLSGNFGARTRGVEFSFTEPYFLDQRIAAGFDVFSKYNDNTKYSRYESRVVGATLRAGLPITEEFSVGIKYSLFETNIKIPNTIKQPYNDCTVSIPGFTPVSTNLLDPTQPTCGSNGEASIAIKEARGKTLTSLVGLGLTYNTLDNNQNPTDGFYAELRPDIAGLGGDSKYVRVTGEARYYYSLFDDVVAVAKIQGGHISGFGSQNRADTQGGSLRLTDQFFLGPSLVRGFAPSGIGPRDTSIDPRSNAIGGTTYYGASAEVQFPIYGLPRDFGLKGALFADAGSLFGYKGARSFDANGNGIFEGSNCTGARSVQVLSVQPECISVRDKNTLRSSVGAGILWASPLGPIRFDYAIALSKDSADRTQAFRFSGGSKF